MKIGFLDMGSWFNKDNNFFVHALKHTFENVEVVDPRKAETLIFSVFGEENQKLRYKFKKKIFFSGEPWDTNQYKFDYSLTYEPSSEKNFHLPFWMSYIDWFNLNKNNDFDNWLVPESHLNTNNPFSLKLKDRFCSFVFSRKSNYRNNIIEVLQGIGKVDCYGNLWGETPNNKKLKNGQYYKIDTISEYKFNIAFENTIKNGYVTEKILQSRIAGCIPIYSGDDSVEKVFNKDGFLNVTGMTNDEIFEEVSSINLNNKRYKLMKNEEIFEKKPRIEDVFLTFNKLFSNL